MINLFYKFLRLTDNKFIERCIIKLANITAPVWYGITFTPYLNSTQNDIIVSLTSFPKRISKIHLVIESLLRQTLKPDRILLYLSKDQFGENIQSACLPKKLLKLQKHGLKIVLVDGDIRSYKKFQYSFKEYPDSVVVTVDDDIIYSSDLIRTLYRQKTDGNVTANLTRKIAKNSNGELLPYSQWEIDNNPSNSHIVIGAGGVMYKPKTLHPDTLNSNIYLKLAPKADDMWLSAMAILNGITITPTAYPNKFIGISIPENETLYSVNSDGNNIQVSSINNYYITNHNSRPF